jgi:hypothetical protein
LPRGDAASRVVRVAKIGNTAPVTRMASMLTSLSMQAIADVPSTNPAKEKSRKRRELTTRCSKPRPPTRNSSARGSEYVSRLTKISDIETANVGFLALAPCRYSPSAVPSV